MYNLLSNDWKGGEGHISNLHKFEDYKHQG